MTAAEELRAAAARLRRLVDAISPPNPKALPFHADDRHVTQGEYGLYDVAVAETPECAAYIAAMGPPVALAVADWLDRMADANEAVNDWTLGVVSTLNLEALALARSLTP